VNDHFNGWVDLNNGQNNAVTGFIWWAKDCLEDTVNALRTSQLDQVVDDIDYSVRQHDEYRCINFQNAAKEWLASRKEEILSEVENQD
jgi:hypothetical protein